MKFYLVGGVIRDEIRSKFLDIPFKPKDIDLLAIGGNFNDLRNELLNRGANIFVEKPEYLTIRCNLPGTGPCDVALARGDGVYSDGRRPDSVSLAKTIEEDLARRDATCNAIAKDLETGEYIDPFNGIGAIKINQLIAVGNAKKRIKEDALRVFRYLRFKITLDFTFDTSQLWDAIVDAPYYANFENVSSERIYEELKKMFAHDWLASFNFLKDSRLEPLVRVIYQKGIKLMPTLA